jgi:hypothetical protein
VHPHHVHPHHVHPLHHSRGLARKKRVHMPHPSLADHHQVSTLFLFEQFAPVVCSLRTLSSAQQRCQGCLSFSQAFLPHVTLLASWANFLPCVTIPLLLCQSNVYHIPPPPLPLFALITTTQKVQLQSPFPTWRLPRSRESGYES